jgi:acetyl-CoA carboxylase carboxyltransferase component
MFLTGPEVVRSVTGEQISAQDLGGAAVHMGRSGVAHLSAADDASALELVKQLLGYLPQNNSEDPPPITPYDPAERMDAALDCIVPETESQAYDMRDVLGHVFDRASVLELQPDYAPNALVAFARLDGFPVGVVANQPAHLAGALDIDASDKIARFIRCCDAYNIPVVSFVDCPGFLPGSDQEHARRDPPRCQDHLCLLRSHGAQDLASSRASAMGGAYVAMGSKQMRTDLAFAWPTAQIAVMGAEPAVHVLYRQDVRDARRPRGARTRAGGAYREKFFNPYRAADLGQIDEVIEPRETRPRLIRALELLRTKVQQSPPKKHGLPPN